MNAFYLGLVPEDERCRVENLEPFDEYEVSYIVSLFCISERRLEEKAFPIIYGIAYVNALKVSELQVIRRQINKDHSIIYISTFDLWHEAFSFN